jgi:uncharacterized protein involved in exopolysaccharide biosynthesis
MADKVNGQLGIFKRIFLWSPANSNRKPRYIISGALILAVIWSLTITYIKFAKPIYRSEWTLVLPGKGAGANVSLVDIGQTSTAAASPYANSSTSAKANYKEFAISSYVIKNAALQMDIPLPKFAKPRVKLIVQTSLLYFSIEGGSAVEAQEKAFALHHSFLSLLDKLRKDETYQQQGSAAIALEAYREKLNYTSQQLLDFQSSSNLVSMSQFNELVMSIEKLRREQIQSIALLSQLKGKNKSLRGNLGMDAKQANSSLVLQNDNLFQEVINEYSKSQINYTITNAKWGANHPQVKKALAENESIIASLNSRYQSLVGTNKKINRELLQLKSDKTRNKFLQDLIDFDVAILGLKNKISALQTIINELIQERNDLTIPASKLDELIRNHQVAEAIFTSALARTGTSKSDVFVSYPLVQILDSPSLPLAPSSPNKLFALFGACVSSLFTIIGLILLWIRKPFVQKILKSA